MGWFTPKCPVSEKQKIYLDDATQWLLRKFAIAPAKVAIVLPTPEFFPDTYYARGEHVQARVVAIGIRNIVVLVVSIDHGSPGLTEQVTEMPCALRYAATASRGFSEPRSVVPKLSTSTTVAR